MRWAMAHINNDYYYYNIVRVNIRKFRLKKNLTQAKLAELASISSDYLCEIESLSKQKTFSIAVLGRIADALEVDIAKFFQK